MKKQVKADLKVESSRERIGRNLPKKPDNYKLIYRPKTQKEFEDLADELDIWSKLPTSVNINDFPLSKNISPYRFKRFDNEYFQEKLQMAKYRVSARNRALVNKRECEKEIYFKELYLLDQDYKEAEDDKIAKRVKGIKTALGPIEIIDHAMDTE